MKSEALSERAGGSHGGRHLDATRDDALRDAALKMLCEVGYDRLTIDAVAQCAGAGKATIYRRWPNKAALVIDALVCHKKVTETPDSGSLRGDLYAIAARASTGGYLDVEVMVGLVSALPRDPDLREAFANQLSAPHTEELRTVLQRAADRGEIRPTQSVELIASIVPALVMHRLMVEGRAPDAHFLRRVIDETILPVVGLEPQMKSDLDEKEKHE